MRILLAVILIAALGWSGYWFYGKTSIERELDAWFQARQAEGWVVEVEEISTTGFPNRFDTTLSDLELADPETGIAWKAPFLQIFALSYRPNHVIAVWPDSQTVATPLQTITITSDDMRGSIVFEPGIALALDHTTTEFANLGLVSTLGWQMSATSGQLAVRQTPIEAHSYDVSLQARDLVLPGRLRETMTNRGLAEEEMASFDLRATVAFDRQWDRRAIEERRPQPRRIMIDHVRAGWGELDLRLAGELEIDDEGQPTGEIAVKAENWREILAIGQASGAIPGQMVPMLESGLGMIARMSGNSATIDVPLAFRDGRISLAGILPLGPAPVLRLR